MNGAINSKTKTMVFSDRMTIHGILECTTQAVDGEDDSVVPELLIFDNISSLAFLFHESDVDVG